MGNRNPDYGTGRMQERFPGHLRTRFVRRPGGHHIHNPPKRLQNRLHGPLRRLVLLNISLPLWECRSRPARLRLTNCHPRIHCLPRSQQNHLPEVLQMLRRKNKFRQCRVNHAHLSIRQPPMNLHRIVWTPQLLPNHRRAEMQMRQTSRRFPLPPYSHSLYRRTEDIHSVALEIPKRQLIRQHGVPQNHCRLMR